MESSPFFALLLITSLAVIIPVLFSRLRRVQLPIVIGEILAGIIIGHSGFDLLETSETLDFMAEFGFAYLMFLAGLEINFELITCFTVRECWRDTLNQPLPLAIIVFLLTFLLAILGSLGLQQFTMIENPVLMGLILSTTSLGLVAPILKERELMTGEYGQFLLIAASIADFATLLLLTVVIAAMSSGLTLDLLLIPVLLLIFALAARAGQHMSRLQWLRNLMDELSHATAQIRIRGAFALMVAWVVLAETLGVELILGAFLAGAIVNLGMTEDDEEAIEKLDAIGYGFFIPIFFFMVGVELDLRSIFESPAALLLVPELLILAFLVKVIPSALLIKRFGRRNALAAGMLLSSRLSLIIAASALAREIGAITAAIETDIVLIAVLTCTIAPLLFNRLYQPEAKPDQRHGLIIVGTDQLTELLARRLSEVMEEITIVASSTAHFNDLNGSTCQVVYGDNYNAQLLEQAGIEKTAAVVVLPTDNDTIHRICRLAREQYEVPMVIARVNETTLIPKLKAMQVRVVQPALATAMSLEGALRYPTAFDMLGHEVPNIEILEMRLASRRYTNQPVHKIRLPGNALILSIKRDGAVIIPQGDTRLERGDHIALIGRPEAVKEAEVMFSR
jgi:Kef-type K+ transport system membrane component KefB/Trk K+ transport system NAD-binding subunit